MTFECAVCAWSPSDGRYSQPAPMQPAIGHRFATPPCVVRIGRRGITNMTKHRYGRRAFIGLTGAGIAGLASAPWRGFSAAAAPAADAQDADLIVVNAKVYTVDASRPRA